MYRCLTGYIIYNISGETFDKLHVIFNPSEKYG